jgi:hypothetical protein
MALSSDDDSSSLVGEVNEKPLSENRSTPVTKKLEVIWDDDKIERVSNTHDDHDTLIDHF